jgi:hypothetical protein
MVRPPSDFVKSRFDDTKKIVESILSDGVESINTSSIGNNGSPVNLNDKLDSEIPATPEGVITVGRDGRLVGGQRQTIPDGDKIVLRSGFDFGFSGIFLFRADNNNESAIVTATEDSVSIQNSDGPWSASDTGTDHCVFLDANDDLVLKNRTGTSDDYRIAGLSL